MRRLFAFLLLSVAAWGTTTVTGKVQTLGTGNVTSGAFVRFWLRGCAGNQPRITGTSLIGPTQGGVYFFDIPADGSGNISGTIYSTRDASGSGNGEIECGGSYTSVWYGMQAFSAGKGGPEVPVHAKNGSSLDVSTVTPITTNPVIIAPTGDTVYARLDTGNQPFLGSITPTGSGTLSVGTLSNRWKLFATTLDLSGIGTFSGNNTLSGNNAFSGSNTHSGLETFGVSLFKTLNLTRYADQFPGVTADAQILAAYNDLPSTGGVVDATGFGCIPQTWANAISLGTSSKHILFRYLQCTPWNVTITGGTTALTFAPQSTLDALGGGEISNGGFILASSANVADVIKIDQTGAGGGSYRGLQVVGNATATVSGALVHGVNLFQVTDFRSLVITGNANAYGLKLDFNASGSGNLTIYDPDIDCQGLTGCKPVYINTSAATGVVSGITFVTGSLTHPGTGGTPIVDIEDTGGSQQNNGVEFLGTQFESWNTTDIGVLCNGCRGLGMYSTSFTAHVNPGTACVKISGANADLVSIYNLNNFNLWTHSIQNSVNSLNKDTARIGTYVYNWGSGGGDVGTNSWESSAGTILTVDSRGSILGARTFANLGTPVNGTTVYCSDCNATCSAGASTGRTCFRENGAWIH